jgi:putative membrane protein
MHVDSALQDRLLRRAREASRRTRAEVVIVVANRAIGAGPEVLAVGGLLALAVPGVLWASGGLTDFPRLYLVQAAVLLLTLLLYVWPPAVHLVVPQARRAQAAARLAREAFWRIGLQRSGWRGSVMVFVTLAERQVEVLADEAAQLALPDDSYARAVELFVKEVRANGLESAFAVTLNFLADRLERALPRLPSDGNGTRQPLLLL